MNIGFKALALALPLALFAACSNKASESNSSIARASGAPAGGPRAGKPTGENTPQDVLELLKTLEISHQMFQQVWLKVWPESRQQIETPFFALKKRLLRHQQGSTGWVESFEQCPQYASRLEIEKKNQGGREVISKLKLSRVSCQNREASEVAEIQFKPQEILLKMQRSHFRDGFGLSLQTVGGTATCRFGLNAQRRLETMKCVGLGQNHDNETHLVFDHFEYSRSSQRMMIVRGSKYRAFRKSCEVPEPQPCIDITVPLNGAIRISENLIRTEDREKYRRELDRIQFENAKIEQEAQRSKTTGALAQPQDGRAGPRAAPKVPDALDGEMTDTREGGGGTGLRRRAETVQGRPATAPTTQQEPKPMSERELRDRLGLRPEEPLPDYVRPVPVAEAKGADGSRVEQIGEPETRYVIDNGGVSAPEHAPQTPVGAQGEPLAEPQFEREQIR